MSLDPAAFGRAAARATLAQDARRHLTAVPGGSAAKPRHIVNLHPSTQPAPAPVELFDREQHDDRPTLPTLVDLALSVLTRYFLAATANPADHTDPTRWEHAQQAARIVTMWRAGGVAADADDAPANGYPRPGA